MQNYGASEKEPQPIADDVRNSIDGDNRQNPIQTAELPGDKFIEKNSNLVQKDKTLVPSKSNVVSEDNRFVLPAGGGTDLPDVVDNNGGGEVVVDGRTAVGDIILPGNVDGGNGNTSSVAGDSFTVTGDDFETKIKYVILFILALIVIKPIHFFKDKLSNAIIDRIYRKLFNAVISGS